MLYGLAAHTSFIPGWSHAPDWFVPAARTLAHFVKTEQPLGLFLVIFAEELGIPLPAPGDVAITFGGYLTTTGAMPFALAFVSVVLGATLGSCCLYGLSRRFGHPFLVRFGPYVGLTEERLRRAEQAFRRWGPWTIIIGRHVPGMRIVISAFAGVFEFPLRIFVVCVLVSSSAWALIFLELGRALGRHSRSLFRLFPAHLVPVAVLLLAVLWVGWLALEQRSRLRKNRRSAVPPDPGPPPRGGGERPGEKDRGARAEWSTPAKSRRGNG